MTKKINILTLVLSEKQILNETKNHTPPPLQVKWSFPYGILVHNYKNIMITLQKEQENPLKSVFVFELGKKSLYTVYPWALRPYHPSAFPQTIQKCFRVVQSDNVKFMQK